MPKTAFSFFVCFLLIFALFFGFFPHALAAENEVIVAVIDGGVEATHPELLDRVFGDIEHPQGSHGTKVAGIIAGAAPEARIMSISVCGQLGCAVDSVSDAIRYASDHGAEIINLSLASTAADGFTDEFNDAIKYAYDRGILIVAAAGNEGIDTDKALISPVCNDGSSDMVLGVGSLDKYNVRSEWSNRGGCVDVYFAGEGIVATGLPQYDGGYYIEVSGTSYAAAMASGLAAIILAAEPGLSRADLVNEIKRRSPRVLGESTSAYLVMGSDNRMVYLIQNGIRRGFPTPEVFFSYGYKFSEVGRATSEDLALPEGEIVL